MMQKILVYLKTAHVQEIEHAMTQFFIFFFHTRNVVMERSTGVAYARFIQKNLIQSLQVRLELIKHNAPGEERTILEKLLEEQTISATDLFG